jgi:hypothetical protein
MNYEPEALAPRLAYLVRCWPVETEEGLVWRATIQSAHDAERRTFANLKAFFEFMTEKTEGCTRAISEKRG